jgi:hypothetical protein
MKIAIMPNMTSAVAHHRLIWPAQAVQKTFPNWDIKIYDAKNVQVVRHKATGKMLGIEGVDMEDLDLFIMQTPSEPEHIEMLDMLGKSGIATIFDVDDAYWALPEEHPAKAQWSTASAKVMDRAASVVDLVTVSNNFLEHRYLSKGGRTEVLPNRIMDAVTDLETTVTGAELGWTGFVGNRDWTDFKDIGQGVSLALFDAGKHLRVVGDGHGLREALDLQPSTQVFATGGVDPELYYGTVAQAFNVGMVPIGNSTFNRGKSSLKAQEFAALGMPVVASNVQVHRDRVGEKYNIFLAETPQQWYNGVTMFLKDPDLTAEIGAHNRRVAKAHSLSNHATDWAQAWSRAVRRRSRIH